jgi:hypothetical protein
MSNEKLLGIILSISNNEDSETSLENNKINITLPVKNKKSQNSIYRMRNLIFFII